MLLNTKEFFQSFTTDENMEGRFTNFLKSKFCIDNYEMWKRVKPLIEEDHDEEHISNEIKSLRDKYMTDSSNNEIAFDSNTKSKWDECVENPEMDKNMRTKILKNTKTILERLMFPDISNFQLSINNKIEEKMDISEENLKKRLLEKLMLSEFNLLRYSLDISAPEEESNEMVKMVIFFLGNRNLLMKFLEHCFDHRLENTFNENEILREDDIDTKLISNLDNIFFAEYIKNILKKDLKKILQSPKKYQLNLGEEEDRDNFERIIKICDDIFTNIENTLSEIPHFLVDICKMARDKTTKKFGTDGKKSIKSIFYLRIIQKGIVFPERFCILEKKTIFREERNALSAISRVMKNILCKSDFSIYGKNSDKMASLSLKSDVIIDKIGDAKTNPNHHTNYKEMFVEHEISYEIALNNICKYILKYEEKISRKFNLEDENNKNLFESFKNILGKENVKDTDENKEINVNLKEKINEKINENEFDEKEEDKENNEDLLSHSDSLSESEKPKLSPKTLIYKGNMYSNLTILKNKTTSMEIQNNK